MPPLYVSRILCCRSSRWGADRDVAAATTPKILPKRAELVYWPRRMADRNNMSGYSSSKKSSMDSETWHGSFRRLVDNQPSMNKPEFRCKVRALAGQAGQHRFSDKEYVVIQSTLAKYLATEGKSLARIACSRFFEIATDNRMINRATWDTGNLSSCRTPGIDGLTLEDFTGGGRVVDYSRALSQRLHEGEYEPDPLRTTCIAKPDGGKRKLLIPTIEDRIIQRSILATIEPYLDALFLPNSFGFRKRKDRLDALAAAYVRSPEKGALHVVAADVKNAFPSTPKDRLFQVVRKYLFNEPICDLVEQAFSNCAKGMPQGAPLSPIMVNLYLHHLVDRKWQKLGSSCELLRYADDLLVVCSSRLEAEESYRELNKLVVPAGYRLKTDLENSVFDAGYRSSFEWLGYKACLRPFEVSVAEKGWWQLRENLEYTIKHATKDNVAALSKQATLAWLKQALPPMAEGQLGYVLHRVEEVINDLNLPVQVSFAEIRELHVDAAARWTVALAKAQDHHSENDALVA